MTDKPEGPIWIDMANMLFHNLTAADLVTVANLALNRLDMRAIGEICYEIGLRPEFRLVDKEMSDE